MSCHVMLYHVMSCIYVQMSCTLPPSHHFLYLPYLSMSPHIYYVYYVFHLPYNFHQHRLYQFCVSCYAACILNLHTHTLSLFSTSLLSMCTISPILSISIDCINSGVVDPRSAVCTHRMCLKTPPTPTEKEDSH